MNTSNDVWCDLAESKIVVGDVYREAYYRLKNRCHQLETRLKEVEGATQKFRNRAKSWLHHLEQIFLNGNELIIDRGNNYHKYIRMIRSYEDVKFRSSDVQRTLNEAIKMKNDIGQQILKLREQTADNQALSEKIDRHVFEEQRLKEVIQKQDTEIKKTPQYLEILRKHEKLQKRHKQVQHNLEELVMANQAKDEQVKKLQTEAKGNIRQQRSWTQQRVQFEKVIKEQEDQLAALKKALSHKDNRIDILTKEVKRKEHILNENKKKNQAEMKQVSGFIDEKKHLEKELKVSYQKNSSFQRDLLRLRKKLERLQSLKLESDSVGELKSLLVEKDQQIWKLKDSIISLQQKLTVLRKILKEKEDAQMVIVDELAREKEHAIQANAAAVVASTKLARTRSLQNEIEDANKDEVKPEPGRIFADGVYVERMEWEKELRK